eukprot:TRINITY_DN1880_c0_g1_i2.p1 TRINITY_DN1880_c0_g1~~TRINITY_DN1880_c0_g1_i2.p1  ORF type:complete len:212 (-),score=30.71 TRINITY_DN1880_c0_g1_i2:21-656(-)
MVLFCGFQYYTGQNHWIYSSGGTLVFAEPKNEKGEYDFWTGNSSVIFRLDQQHWGPTMVAIVCLPNCQFPSRHPLEEFGHLLFNAPSWQNQPTPLHPACQAACQQLRVETLNPSEMHAYQQALDQYSGLVSIEQELQEERAARQEKEKELQEEREAREAQQKELQKEREAREARQKELQLEREARQEKEKEVQRLMAIISGSTSTKTPDQL